MPDADALTGDFARADTSLLPMRARRLSYRVGKLELISDIDLSLGARGITVIMGPNGAGKSLLLRLMHGLLEPSAGEILWNGAAINDRLRKRQALIFQRPVLLRRSVRANIEFVLRLRSNPRGQTANELLQQVGLEHRIDQPARRLSGGEQQRLAMARALALEPEILFMDEPTANLDPSSTAAIEAIVSAARQSGTRIVLVTHDIGQARRLADDVVFLHHGRVSEHSNATQFFLEPGSTHARDYLAGRLVL